MDFIRETGEERYSGGDGNAGKAALLTTGIGGAVALGTALIGKNKQLTDVEQKCGKRPKIGRKKKEAWQKCADEQNTRAPQKPTGTDTTAGTQTNTQTQQGMSKGMKIGLIVGGVVVVGLVLVLVLKRNK